jgi:sugar phosphate isomerase/epimerase
MKFAFASHPPATDFSVSAFQAKSLGYDGVEVHDIPADPKMVRRNFADAGIEICCLATSIAYSRKNRVIAADELKRSIDLAAALGASLMKLPGDQGRTVNPIEFGDWLLPQGDLAADAGIGIVIENGRTWPNAQALWSLLDRINHPSIACCWNLSNAIQAGEPPSISVPVLNSKIQYAQVSHVEREPPGLPLQRHASPQTAPTEKFIKRLRGIGYTGYVTVTDSDSLECLSNTLAKLRHWDQRLKISDAEAAARGA